MARKQVVEVQCDRCKRVEHREGSKSDVHADAFMATMGIVHVNFVDLCTPCQNTVRNHLESIGKKIDGLSPDRKPDEVGKKKPVTRNGVVVSEDVED